MKINKSVNPLPLIILIIALTKLTGLQGKAIYVDGKLSDDNGNGSLQNPKKYITSGIRLLTSGDTLIIKDGVYKGQSNIIHQNHRPPNGTVNSFTVIKAQNMGKVFIDGEYLLKPVEIGNLSYIVFDGIIFCQSSETNFTLVDSDHIKIIRCGFCDANNTPTQRANHILMRYCEYVLLEDCFTWGTAKYRFYVLDSKFIILRRCLDRFDRGIDNGPYSNLASYRIYGSNNVLLQNCISIDADTDLILNNNNGELVPADPKLLFIGGNPSTNNRSEDNLIEGCIFLNCKSNGWIGFGGKDMSSNNTLRNSVFWDLNGSFWTRGSSTTAHVNHCTIGNIQYENNSHDRAIESDFSGNVEVYNSIIYNTGSEALRNVRSNYNVLFDNYKNYSGTAVGYNDICTENNNAIDPIDGSPGNGSPALKYLLKIETESDLANTSSENSNSGATIIKKIGINGTLFGEDGYNRLTDESLWPWQNEHIIKNLLQKYHYDDGKNTITGERGFCADNQTLTNYIWGYLGNEPPDFYPPYLNFDNLSPEPDAMAVDINSVIQINLQDDATGIDVSSVIININNETIYSGDQPDLYPNISVSGTVHNYVIKYTPPQTLPANMEIKVSVEACDLASPPNTMATATYSFMTGTDSDVEQHDPVSITQNRLNQNYPNPFNAGTTIEYELIKSGRINLQIYNIAGQVIKSLARGERPKGVHKIHWDGNDDTGIPASSGMYFCKFLTDSFIQSRKIIKLE